MDIQWYIFKNGVQYGPFTDTQFHEQVQKGFVKPYDFLWNNKFGRWVRADQVSGVFNILPGPQAARQIAKENKPQKKAIIPILIGVVSAIIIFIAGAALLSAISATNSTSAESNIKKIESAFESRDINKAVSYVHPELQEQYRKIFEQHQSELDRIGKLMEGRKLIKQGECYAEYQVSENGKFYYMLFEKIDGKWVLSTF